MYSQSIHLTHELILCIQIKRGRVHFNRDSTAKSPCWHQVLNLWPSHPDLLQSAAIPSLQDLAIFMAPHSRAPFKWPVLWGTALQQSPASCPEHRPDSPRACMPWKSLPPICLAHKLPQRSPAFVNHANFVTCNTEKNLAFQFKQNYLNWDNNLFRRSDACFCLNECIWSAIQADSIKVY